MNEFQAKSIQLRGEFRLDGSVEGVFPVFSPLGEKAWVPQWNPELIFPPGVEWQRGQIFRTHEERGEAIWVITQLDRDRHHVEYHRVEPGRYVARVSVQCAPLGGGQTKVEVEYEFIGLSETGNADIAAMSPKAYAEKMKRWQIWLTVHLKSNS